MYTTQLNGLFQRIAEKEEQSIEESARLLAQALVGEGKIYVKGFGEMEAVTSEIEKGLEPLIGAQRFENLEALTEADRVLIITRFCDDHDPLELARQLNRAGIPFVGVSGIRKNSDDTFQSLADVHIQTHAIRGLLPTETGERTALPSSLAGIYIYQALKFTVQEIIEDYEC
jgi:uncharacterized phosphosugar-binding protein